MLAGIGRIVKVYFLITSLLQGKQFVLFQTSIVDKIIKVIEMSQNTFSKI